MPKRILGASFGPVPFAVIAIHAFVEIPFAMRSESILPASPSCLKPPYTTKPPISWRLCPQSGGFLGPFFCTFELYLNHERRRFPVKPRPAKPKPSRAKEPGSGTAWNEVVASVWNWISHVVPTAQKPPFIF